MASLGVSNAGGWSLWRPLNFHMSTFCKKKEFLFNVITFDKLSAVKLMQIFGNQWKNRNQSPRIIFSRLVTAFHIFDVNRRYAAYSAIQSPKNWFYDLWYNTEFHRDQPPAWGWNMKIYFRRFPVPDARVSSQVSYPTYKPDFYSAKHESSDSLDSITNDVIDDYKNPMGRTGIRGRGQLWNWGENRQLITLIWRNGIFSNL